MTCPVLGKAPIFRVYKEEQKPQRMAREEEWKLQWLGAKQEGNPQFQIAQRSQDTSVQLPTEQHDQKYTLIPAPEIFNIFT